MRNTVFRKYHYIYKIIRDDGKYYVGMHSTDNLDDGYLGSGKHITRSVKKHGIEKHVKEFLFFAFTRLHLIELEREFVNVEMLKDPLCMNLCVGGRWGVLSEESRSKISESNRRRVGMKHSLTRNKKLSDTKRGQKFSDEHRKSIGIVKRKPCTVDGVTIYASRGDLVAELGTGKLGERSPAFRYV